MVAAVASDDWLVELVPRCEPPSALYPLHPVRIRDVGMTLRQLLDLEGLAAYCSGGGVSQSLLAAAGLRVTGAAGSPMTPVAIEEGHSIGA